MPFHTIQSARGVLLLGSIACTAAFAVPASASPVETTAETFFVETYSSGNTSYHLSGTVNDSDTQTATDFQSGTATSSESTADASSVYSSDVGALAGGAARASLADGTLKADAYADNSSTGVNDNVSADDYSYARMGDTLTFADGVGTTVDVTLDIDGSIFSTAPAAVPGASSQVQLAAYIAVFDASAGADSSNWTCFLSSSCATGPLASDIYTINYDGHSDAIDEYINQTLTASVTLSSDNAALKVFGHLSVLSVRGDDNAGNTDLDFLNTATFGVNTASGVTFSSASGGFPGSGTSIGAVPLPAAGLSLITGLLALAGFRRRRRAA